MTTSTNPNPNTEATNPETAQALTVHGLTPKTPPPARVRRDWASIIAALRATPGQWYVVAEDVAVSTSTRLKSRYGPNLETRLAKVDPNTQRAAELYARYTGTKE